MIDRSRNHRNRNLVSTSTRDSFCMRVCDRHAEFVLLSSVFPRSSAVLGFPYFRHAGTNLRSRSALPGPAPALALASPSNSSSSCRQSRQPKATKRLCAGVCLAEFGAVRTNFLELFVWRGPLSSQRWSRLRRRWSNEASTAWSSYWTAIRDQIERLPVRQVHLVLQRRQVILFVWRA